MKTPESEKAETGKAEVKTPGAGKAEVEKATPADEGLGRSRGGFTSESHIATDALGNPVRILLTGGRRAGVTRAEALMEGLKAKAVIADKGYDSDRVVRAIVASGAEAVIPPKANRKVQREYDRHLYKQRNGVERFVNHLKQFRRVATRYEKRGRNFLAFAHLAAAMMLLR